MKKWFQLLFILALSAITLVGCSIEGFLNLDEDKVIETEEIETETNKDESTISEITSIDNLVNTDIYKHHALTHILEGEINRKGQAVGFHYNNLPTKQGEIIDGTKTSPNRHGVYEAKVKVSNVNKTSNSGKSTFFPDDFDTQDVVDAINEAHGSKTHINGNTYEGLSNEGMVIRMYLDDHENIISAFPVY